MPLPVDEALEFCHFRRCCFSLLHCGERLDVQRVCASIRCLPKKGREIEVSRLAKRTVTSEPTRREELKNDLFGSEVSVLSLIA